MLEARIVWPDGSFYFSAEATPYDLETLGQHLRELADSSHGDVRLDLMLANTHNMDGPTAQWLTRLAHAGVKVSVNSLFFLPADTSSHACRSHRGA